MARTRRTLLLAYVVAEYDSTIASIAVLNDSLGGQLIGGELLVELERERDRILADLSEREGTACSVEDARNIVTAHLSELDDALEQEGYRK